MTILKGEQISQSINNINNGNRTEWSTIQRVIGQVISKFEIKSTIAPELCDTKSYY